MPLEFPSFDAVGAHLRCFENVSNKPFSIDALYGIDPQTAPLKNTLYRMGYTPASGGSFESIAKPWGRFFDRTVHLFKDFRFTPGANVPSDEHTVFHRNILGKLGTVPGLSGYHRSADDYTAGPIYDGLNLHNVEEFTAYFPNLPNIDEGDTVPAFFDDQGALYSTNYIKFEVEKMAARINDTTWNELYFYYGWGMWWDRHYRNFSVTLVETDGMPWVSSFEYDIFLCLRDSNPSYSFHQVRGWRVKTTFSLSRTSALASLVTGEARCSQLFQYKALVESKPYNITEHFTWDTATYSFPLFTWFNVSPSLTGNTYTREYIGRTQLAATPTFGGYDELIGWSNTTGYHSLHSKTFQATTNRLSEYIPDAMSAMFMPYTTAMDTLMAANSDNHYESLSEFPSMVDFLNPLDNQSSLVKGLGLRNKKLGMFLGILDLCTDAVLIWKLGLAPSYSSSVSLANTAKELYKRVQKVTQPQIVRGKWQCSFVTDDGEEFSVLLCCKVQARVNPDSLLVGLLPLNTVGLLPSLSSIWDFVPLSFVVDWFLKIGQSLDVASGATRMLAVDHIYGVYSFKFTRHIAKEATEAGLSAGLGLSSPRYVLYGRYSNSIVPWPSPTRLPILGQAGIPDYTLFGSLLFKFLS